METSDFVGWIIDEFSAQAEKDLESLPRDIKNIMCILLVHYPIGNGGFRFLFEMKLNPDVSYETVVNSYREVGLKDVADQFQKVLDLFPGSEPQDHMDERDAFLTKYFDRYDEYDNRNPNYSGVVEKADDAYFNKFDEIPDVLYQYYKQGNCA